MKIIEAPATNCSNCGAILVDGLCPCCGTRMFYVREDQIIAKVVEVKESPPVKPSMQKFHDLVTLKVFEHGQWCDLFPILSYGSFESESDVSCGRSENGMMYRTRVPHYPSINLSTEYNSRAVDVIKYYNYRDEKYCIDLGGEIAVFTGSMIATQFMPIDMSVEIVMTLTSEIKFETRISADTIRTGTIDASKI